MSAPTAAPAAAISPWLSNRSKAIAAGITACIFFGVGWTTRGAYETHRSAVLAQRKKEADSQAKAWAETKRQAAAAGTVAVLALTAVTVMYVQYKRRYPVQVDLNRHLVQS